MSTTKQLLDGIDELEKGIYIKKPVLNNMTSAIQVVIDHTDKAEKQTLNSIIKLASQQKKLNVEDREKVTALKPKLVKILNKYKEYYNDEPNEDDINEDLTVDEIEAKLDAKVPVYCGFDENHPMKGVSWNKSKNAYQIKYNTLDTTSKKLETACAKIIENCPLNKADFLENISGKNFFPYHNHFFVYYQIGDDFFFDIRHVITPLNLQTTSQCEKYNDFKDKIVHYIWHQNEFGGFILRELISEQSMYQLIMSSNSKFSKNFKKDVSKILADLRKQGKLNITNKKVSLKKTGPNAMMDHKCNDIITSNINQYPVYNYSNPQHNKFLTELLNQGRGTSLSQFVRRHALYLVIIPLKNERGDIVIKFGYSYNIHKRLKSLAKEYKCKVYFIKAKFIDAESDEDEFHDLLKKMYPELIESYAIKSTGKIDKNKVELYKLSPILLKEFETFKTVDTDFVSWLIDTELDSTATTTNYNLMMHYQILKEQNAHNQFILQKKHEKDILMLRNELMDKELELARLKAIISSSKPFDDVSSKTCGVKTQCQNESGNASESNSSEEADNTNKSDDVEESINSGVSISSESSEISEESSESLPPPKKKSVKKIKPVAKKTHINKVVSKSFDGSKAKPSNKKKQSNIIVL